LLHLALHVWFSGIRPQPRAVPELEVAALALSFAPGGVFSPRPAFRPFRVLYASTLSRGDAFNTDTVMKGISSAVHVSLDFGPFDFTIATTDDPALSWTTWARRLVRTHHQRTQSPSFTGAYVYTRDELATTMVSLKRFFEAHGADSDAAQFVAPHNPIRSASTTLPIPGSRHRRRHGSRHRRRPRRRGIYVGGWCVGRGRSGWWARATLRRGSSRPFGAGMSATQRSIHPSSAA
jgi:hypothetical protein